MYAPPYALRSTTQMRGTVAAAYACTSSAPWRIMPRHSRSRPGSKPGVSTNVMIGRLNASHQRDEPGGLARRLDVERAGAVQRAGSRRCRPDGRRACRSRSRGSARIRRAARGTSRRRATSSTTTRTSYDAVGRSGPRSRRSCTDGSAGSSDVQRGGSSRWWSGRYQSSAASASRAASSSAHDERRRRRCGGRAPPRRPARCATRASPVKSLDRIGPGHVRERVLGHHDVVEAARARAPGPTRTRR